MKIFERYLSIWVIICILFGVLLGIWIPAFFTTIAAFEYAQSNIIIGLCIWIMIYPMMVQIDFAALRSVAQRPKGLCITLVVNWLIKPFTMFLIAKFFLEHVYATIISEKDASEYIAGMILLGVAPCTAMVFVWSQLVQGNPNYTLVQVALNDLLMIFLFAPISALLLGMTDIVVPWSTLFFSVMVYVFIPLAAGYYTRTKLLHHSEKQIDLFLNKIRPFSILGLLITVIVLFGLQAKTIYENPFQIGYLAVPLIIQSYLIFAIAYYWAYRWNVPFSIAAPAALIGTSNFFELAIAVAISLFGLNSKAALATVVGVLVEVPVMLSLVSYALKTKKYFGAE